MRNSNCHAFVAALIVVPLLLGSSTARGSDSGAPGAFDAPAYESVPIGGELSGPAAPAPPAPAPAPPSSPDRSHLANPLNPGMSTGRGMPGGVRG
jgi:hypothetical protein